MPDLDSPLEPRDTQTAQTILDAWTTPEMVDTMGDQLLELRGLLAVWAHDLRAAGIAEGYRAGLVQGHQEARQAVQDALGDL